MIRLSFGRKKSKLDAKRADQVKQVLGRRSLVLVGLMGCGKSAIGRRLANKLGLPFVDADEEIETAARQSITEIFAEHGEAFFRERERMVIERLLKDGPQVLATGGGAFMNEQTREAIVGSGISVWLRAELAVLLQRVSKRDTRPLLRTDDPEAVMRRLMEERYPVYATADIMVESRDVPHDVIVGEIIDALLQHGRLDRRPAV